MVVLVAVVTCLVVPFWFINVAIVASRILGNFLMLLSIQLLKGDYVSNCLQNTRVNRMLMLEQVAKI